MSSLLLPTASPGSLAPKTPEAQAEGISWDRGSGESLVDFFTHSHSHRSPSRGDRACSHAAHLYVELAKAAREHGIDQAGAHGSHTGLLQKIDNDAKFYAGADTPRQIRLGEPEVVRRCGLFYGATKPLLEMVVTLVKSDRVLSGKKRDALVLLRDDLGHCEGGAQAALHSAFEMMGGYGDGLRPRVQMAIASQFQILVEELESKTVGVRVHGEVRWLAPGVPGREQMEVHFKPALAAALGADKAYGIEAGVAKSDSHAGRVVFAPADIEAARVKLTEAALMPNIIRTTANEIAGALTEEVFEKRLNRPGEPELTRDRLFRGFDATHLKPDWFEDFQANVRAALGSANGVARFIGFNTKGDCQLFRNTSAVQRDMIEELARDGLFAVDLKTHVLAKTNDVLFSRVGPSIAISDWDADSRSFGDHRSITLTDFAHLLRPADRSAPSAWHSMSGDDQALLVNFVMLNNQPAFFEEAHEMLQTPGLLESVRRGAIPKPVKRIFDEAARVLLRSTWEEVKVSLKPGGNPGSLKDMLEIYRNSDIRLPAAGKAGSGSRPAEHFAMLLASARMHSDLGELLAKGAGDGFLDRASSGEPGVLHKLFLTGKLSGDGLAEVGRQFKKELTGPHQTFGGQTAMSRDRQITDRSGALLGHAVAALLTEPKATFGQSAANLAAVLEHFPVELTLKQCNSIDARFIDRRHEMPEALAGRISETRLKAIAAAAADRRPRLEGSAPPEAPIYSLPIRNNAGLAASAVSASPQAAGGEAVAQFSPVVMRRPGPGVKPRPPKELRADVHLLDVANAASSVAIEVSHEDAPAPVERARDSMILRNMIANLRPVPGAVVTQEGGALARPGPAGAARPNTPALRQALGPVNVRAFDAHRPLVRIDAAASANRPTAAPRGLRAPRLPVAADAAARVDDAADVTRPVPPPRLPRRAADPLAAIPVEAPPVEEARREHPLLNRTTTLDAPPRTR